MGARINFLATIPPPDVVLSMEQHGAGAGRLPQSRVRGMAMPAEPFRAIIETMGGKIRALLPKHGWIAQNR